MKSDLLAQPCHRQSNPVAMSSRCYRSKHLNITRLFKIFIRMFYKIKGWQDFNIFFEAISSSMNPDPDRPMDYSEMFKFLTRP